MRARTVLLGSGDISLSQQIWAHRVLAEDSPAANLPKLVEALLRYSYQEVGDEPEAKLAVFAEAVDAARRMDGDRRRGGLLLRALSAWQWQLFVLGRRAEGFEACVELAGIGREEFEAGRADNPVHGQERLAVVLAEEGRHEEAAAIYRRKVEVERAQGPQGDIPFWSTIAWVAELDAAGEHEEALGALGEIVTATRAKLDEGHTSLAIMLWELITLSQALDARGRHDDARDARREAGGLAAELAESGERKSWSNIQSWWATLLGLSGRADEPPAVPPTAESGFAASPESASPSSTSTDVPRPAFGLPTFTWSPDVKVNYFGERAALEAATAALAPLADRDPGRHLADLVTLHRRLTICSALYWQSRTYRIVEPLQPLFDEGVALARRLAEVEADQDQGNEFLVRALTDRSAFFVAAKLYSEALTDFHEATTLLDAALERSRPLEL